MNQNAEVHTFLLLCNMLKSSTIQKAPISLIAFRQIQCKFVAVFHNDEECQQTINLYHGVTPKIRTKSRQQNQLKS